MIEQKIAPDFARIVNDISRDCCEVDPADRDYDSTISIGVETLSAILKAT